MYKDKYKKPWYGNSTVFYMHFHIITLFPESFDSYLHESILARAQKEKKIKVSFYNPREFVKGKYRKVWPDGNVSKIVDDRPYGGGPGMVIRAEPVLLAVEKAYKKIKDSKKAKVFFFSPSGIQFSSDIAEKTVKKYTDIILICGRYEGIDARVQKILKAEELSVGPYVLTGGELPAMIVLDSISRRVKGVLGNLESVEEYRVSSSEVYTRPEAFVYKGKGYVVPKVLVEGDHKKIEAWKTGKTTSKDGKKHT
jgi:tRNA (guanine37-N1)-methyltransferase